MHTTARAALLGLLGVASGQGGHQCPRGMYSGGLFGGGGEPTADSLNARFETDGGNSDGGNSDGGNSAVGNCQACEVGKFMAEVGATPGALVPFPFSSLSTS